MKTLVRCLLHLLLALTISQPLHAQNKRLLDSCKNVLRYNKDTLAQLSALYTLSYEYGLIHPRTGIDYGYQGLDLALKQGKPYNILNAYNGLGNAYESLTMYDSALYFHTKSYEYARQSQRTKAIATSLFNIGTCYKELGLYQTALNCYLKSYAMVDTMTDYNPRFHFYIGDLYLRLNNVEGALDHSIKGIRKCFVLKHDYVIHNLYVNLGRCKLLLGQQDSALAILRTAVGHLKGNTDRVSYCIGLNALGEACLMAGKTEEALNHFEIEKTVRKEIGHSSGYCLSLINLAYAHARQSPLPATLVRTYLNEAEACVPNLQYNQDHLMHAYERMAAAYEAIGDYKNALHCSEKYAEAQKALLSAEKVAQMNELNARYEFEKREQVIARQKSDLENSALALERNRLQIITLLVICAAILGTGLLLYNRNRLRQKVKLLTEIQKQEKLREEAIKQKENEERTRIARDIHDELGSGLSKIRLLTELVKSEKIENPAVTPQLDGIAETATQLVENMRDLIWVWTPENNTLANLIARLREYSYDYLEDFPIELSIHAPDYIAELKINGAKARHILMIVKEVLQNTVKHAHAKKVRMDIHLNPDFSVAISDNGKGFDQAAYKAGNGLSNMAHRSQAIGGQFTIQTAPTQGCIATFSISLSQLQQ